MWHLNRIGSTSVLIGEAKAANGQLASASLTKVVALSAVRRRSVVLRLPTRRQM